MILSTPFKKTILISLLGHFAVFSIFSFSFGRRIPAANYTSVFFWGGILRRSDLTTAISQYHFPAITESRPIFPVKRDSLVNLITEGEKKWQKKPAVTLAFNLDKIKFSAKSPLDTPLPRRKDSVLIFHPLLPYHFTLYFKDRQKVHIELMFNIISSERTNSIAIKRKISSGNLEADLLSMRYIGHYLFIQQARFALNNWQTVRIDLSTKND